MKLHCPKCGSETDAFLCSACNRDLAAQIASLPALIRDLEQHTAARQDRLGGSGAALTAIRPVQHGPQKGASRVWDESADTEAQHASQRLARALDRANGLIWVDTNGDELPAGYERTVGNSPSLRATGGRIALPVTPWAYAPDAADLVQVARNTLMTWARHIAETRGQDIELGPPVGPLCRVETTVASYPELRSNGYPDPTPQHLPCHHPSCRAIAAAPGVRTDQWLAMWLIRVGNSIRFDEAAADMADEFEWLIKAIERATDRRDPDLFAGTCDKPDVRVTVDEETGVIVPLVPLCEWTDDQQVTHREYHHGRNCPALCNADLFHRLEDPDITCRACGAKYKTAERKQQLLESAADVWAGAPLIANALSDWDLPVTRTEINLWAHRAQQRKTAGRPPVEGDFYQVSIDDNGAPLYKFGDVRARVQIARDKARTRQAEQAVNKRQRDRITA